MELCIANYIAILIFLQSVWILYATAFVDSFVLTSKIIIQTA
jgi:hypothetical protein